jgi:hypothetical protein
VKILMAVLSLAGIYLRQVKQTGVLGLLGYMLFSIIIMSIEVVGAAVLPSISGSSPGYVSDVLAVATGGHAAGDIGLMQPLNLAAASPT